MSDIDFRFLRAAVALMDELNTSRAAIRLGIGQSAMSKQISALHDALGYPLFIKQGRNMVPTAAGDAFVAQARIALDYAERAKRMSRAAHQHMEVVLHVGKSPYTDPYLITNVLSLRLARKILVGQLSATIWSMPDSSSSLMDCVARIMAAWCLRHVFCACTM